MLGRSGHFPRHAVTRRRARHAASAPTHAVVGQIPRARRRPARRRGRTPMRTLLGYVFWPTTMRSGSRPRLRRDRRHHYRTSPQRKPTRIATDRHGRRAMPQSDCAMPAMTAEATGRERASNRRHSVDRTRSTHALDKFASRGRAIDQGHRCRLPRSRRLVAADRLERVDPGALGCARRRHCSCARR